MPRYEPLTYPFLPQLVRAYAASAPHRVATFLGRVAFLSFFLLRLTGTDVRGPWSTAQSVLISYLAATTIVPRLVVAIVPPLRRRARADEEATAADALSRHL